MVNVAINGFGRIGKQFFLAALEHGVKWNFYINNIGTIETIIYGLKYDSVHPSFKGTIKTDGKNLIINKIKIPVLEELDPEKLPWKKEKIDLVIESSGAFTKRDGAIKHIKAGAKKVLISAPAQGHDSCIAFGVNNNHLNSNHQIVSASSCTTNCVAPMVKVLNDNFKVISAHFLTAHAYTATQGLIDRDDKKDFRRGRAAGMNIVPTSSGATTSVIEIIPELKGKIDGGALRVPVVDGSITEVVAKVSRSTTASEVNKIFKKSAESNLKGILEYTEEPIVSSDIIHNPHSCIFDAKLTSVIGDLVSIYGWYDNEWGYSNRLVELAQLMVK